MLYVALDSTHAHRSREDTSNRCKHYEFGRFDALKATADEKKAKAYFEAIEGKSIIPPKVPIKIDRLLRNFILRGGFDTTLPDDYSHHS